MSVHRSRRLALAGIIVGIILASILSDELILIQARNQAEKDLAEFYVGIISVISASTALLTSIRIFETRSAWISFVRATAATVTLINIIFLSIVPQILTWMKNWT